MLRDFSLRVVDDTGKPISPRDYLEKCLQPTPGNTPQVEEKNKVRLGGEPGDVTRRGRGKAIIDFA